jgi:hypothetical protein
LLLAKKEENAAMRRATLMRQRCRVSRMVPEIPRRRSSLESPKAESAAMAAKTNGA